MATQEKALKQLAEVIESPDIGDGGVMYEELERVTVDTDAEKYFQIGIQLPPQEKEELLVSLRKNINVFSWSVYEAHGVDPNFICII